MQSFVERISGPVAQPWPMVVINLDRATGRMRDATRNLEDNGLSFTRFSAVDGELLAPDLASDLTAGRGFKTALTRAEVGCFASHLLVWHRITQDVHERVIILEDDARLGAGALAHLAKLAGDAVDWDILKLCYTSRSRSPAKDPVVTQPARIPFGTTGYAITRDAAVRLVATAVPFSRPVDIELKTWWEHGLTVKVADPPIGAPADDHEATSSIAPGRDRAGAAAPLARFLRNLRYQIGRRASRLGHAQGARQSPRSGGDLHPAMIRLIEAVG